VAVLVLAAIGPGVAVAFLRKARDGNPPPRPPAKQKPLAGIEGKAIAMTGASEGIDAATALLLVERGAKVVLLGAREATAW
jgi:hypothetical protein